MQYQQDSLAMYKIIGTDGQQYGPISLTELQQWVNDGRVVATTPIQPEGAADWRAAEVMPELAELFPAISQSDRVDRLVSHSLNLGLLGFFSFGIASMVGIFLGIKSLSIIKNSRINLPGRRLAIAGLCISLASLIPGLYLQVEWIKGWQAKKLQRQCALNVKKLHAAILRYEREHDNTLPSATNWCDAIMPYLDDSKVFICPSRAGDGERCHYMFNARLSGRKNHKRGPVVAVIFEGPGGWNSAGGLSHAVRRHGVPILKEKLCVTAVSDGAVIPYPTNRMFRLLFEW